MSKNNYFLFIILLSILFIPNIFAKENIEIKSITLDTKSENTVINSEPTFNGLEMNYDLTFKEVNDFAKYKIIIENNTNKDYKVIEEESFNISEYVSYSYESQQIIKANDTSSIFVIIKYNKAVDEMLLNEGKYSETNKAVLQMTDENNETIVNPDTGVFGPIMLLIVISILSVCIVVIINKNKKTSIMLFLIIVSLIPIITYAIESLRLTINVKVDIEKVEPAPPVETYEVGYLLEDYTLFTDEEADKYTPTERTDCSTVYIGTKKYNNCGYMIIKDTTKYAAGSAVNLKSFTINRINFGPTSCQPTEDRVYLCPENTPLQTITINNWNYDRNREIYEYTYADNDKDIMNFDSYSYEDWISNGLFCITSPSTFTMPQHNTLFINIIEFS